MGDLLNRYKDEFCKYKYVIAASLIAVVIVSYIIFRISNSKDIEISTDSEKQNVTQQNNQQQNEVQKNSDGSSANSNVVEKPKDIIVYVCGAVNKPGIITLNEGSRCGTAIEYAGGLRKEADINSLNLAELITDGEKIYVPKIGEQVTETSGEKSSSQDGKVNLNSADTAALDSIPGIGPSTADKIIEYRNSNGAFKSIDQIKNVSGIGEKKFESIKKYIKI